MHQQQRWMTCLITNKGECVCLRVRSVLDFGFLGGRFSGTDARTNSCRGVGDPCRCNFLTNGLNLQKGKIIEIEMQLLLVSSSVYFSLFPQDHFDFDWGTVCFLLAHLEAYVLEMRVKVVQHSATIKYKGWLQHFLVDLLIVQFLWWM